MDKGHYGTLPRLVFNLTVCPYLILGHFVRFSHIEGKFGVATLTDLPEEIFDDMEGLPFLHLVVHMMARIPRLSGLGNLKYLTFALFLQRQELSSFDGLRSLERIEI